MKIFTTFSSAGWDQMREGMARLGDEGPSIMAAMLNAGGEALREKTVAAETRQTNLSHDTNERAQVPTEASAGRLSFVTTVHGGNVRLKYFHAKEGGGGVTADPWGELTFYRGEFITSGRVGARFAVGKLNGQVYRAAYSNRRWQEKRPERKKQLKVAIVGGRSGLWMPDELLKGATVRTFEEGAPKILDGILTEIAAMV